MSAVFIVVMYCYMHCCASVIFFDEVVLYKKYRLSINEYFVYKMVYTIMLSLGHNILISLLVIAHWFHTSVHSTLPDHIFSSQVNLVLCSPKHFNCNLIQWHGKRRSWMGTCSCNSYDLHS